MGLFSGRIRGKTQDPWPCSTISPDFILENHSLLLSDRRVWRASIKLFLVIPGQSLSSSCLEAFSSRPCSFLLILVKFGHTQAGLIRAGVQGSRLPPSILLPLLTRPVVIQWSRTNTR